MRFLLFKMTLIVTLVIAHQATAKQYSDPELHARMKSFASTCDQHDRQLVNNYLTSVRQLDKTIDSILFVAKSKDVSIVLYAVKLPLETVTLPERSGLVVNTTICDVEKNNLVTSYYDEPVVYDMLFLLGDKAPKDKWGWPLETRLRKLAKIQKARAVLTATLMSMLHYKQRKAFIILPRGELPNYEAAARNFGVTVTHDPN